MLVVWWLTVIDDCSCQTRVIWTKESGNWPRTIHGGSHQEWCFKLGKKIYLVCWDCSDPIQVGSPANKLPGVEAVTNVFIRRVLAHNLLPTFRTPWDFANHWAHWDHQTAITSMINIPWTNFMGRDVMNLLDLSWYKWFLPAGAPLEERLLAIGFNTIFDYLFLHGDPVIWHWN